MNAALLAKAKALAERDGLSIGDALRRIADEEPELVTMYQSAIRPPEESHAIERTPSGEIVKLAQDRARSEGISLRAAIAAVTLERPELAERYRDELRDDDVPAGTSRTSDPATIELSRLATARARDRGIDFASAAREVSAERLDLFERHRDAIRLESR